MTTVDDLQRARHLIATHGLAKATFQNYEVDEFCTVGALMETIAGSVSNVRVNVCVEALNETLGFEHLDPNEGGRTQLYDWNDDPKTSKEDVLKLYNDTIARLS